MDAILNRRRMFGAEEFQPETWDFEWDYSDGLLENNGWTLTITGTGTSTMTADGQRLTSDQNSYIRLYAPDELYDSIGVMEIVAKVTYSSGGDNTPAKGAQNLRCCLSNGTNGIQTCINGYTESPQGLKIMDRSGPSDATYIAPFISGSTHKIRYVLNNGFGSVYLDDNLVASNIDVSTILYSTRFLIGSQNQAGTGSESIIKSVKIRKGRI